MKSRSPLLFALAAGLLIAAPVSAQLDTYNCNDLNRLELQGSQKSYAVALYNQCKQSKSIKASGYDAIKKLYDLSIKWYENPAQHSDELEKILNETVDLSGKHERNEPANLLDGEERDEHDNHNEGGHDKDSESSNEKIQVSLANLNESIEKIQNASKIEKPSEQDTSVLKLLIYKIQDLDDNTYKTFKGSFINDYQFKKLSDHYNAFKPQASTSSYSEQSPNNSKNTKTQKKDNFLDTLQPVLSYLHWLVIAVLGIILANLLVTLKALEQKVQALSNKKADPQLTKINSDIEKLKNFSQKLNNKLIKIENQTPFTPPPPTTPSPSNHDAFDPEQWESVAPVQPAPEPWLTTYLRDRETATRQTEGLLKLTVPLANQMERRKSQADLVLQECSGGEFYYFAYPDPIRGQGIYQVVPNTGKAWIPAVREQQGLDLVYRVEHVTDPSRKKGQIVTISEPAYMRKEYTGDWTLLEAGYLELTGT